MKHIRKFNESKNTIIEHYFVRQNIEVKDIIRKQGGGEEVVINGVGVIKSISDFGDDIAYEVEFNITFNIFHNKDKDNIINVF